MESIPGLVTFALSTCSAVATFYMWAVKARGERPRLKVCRAEPLIGGYCQSSCNDPVKLVFDVKVIVANDSSLPNAVLGLRAWVRALDGSWLPAEAAADPKTPLPLNLPAMQTARLNLLATVAVAAVPEGESCRNTNETFALYRRLCLADPLEVRIELTALNDRAFTGVLASRKAA